MSTCKLYRAQVEALGSLRPGSILCGGVGTGKSRTSLAFFFCSIGGGKIDFETGEILEPMHDSKRLVILTTARKRDTLEWSREMAIFGLSEGSEGVCDVTVDSWNNIKKYETVKGAFFILDEQRLVGSGAWVKAFYKIAKANQWILLSATPGDTWLDYAPVFIANGFYANITEFRAQHVIYKRFRNYPQVDRYVGVKHLEALRKKLLVDIPLERETRRHHEYCVAEHDRMALKGVWKKRWNPFENAPIKTASELCQVLRRLVSTDPSRRAELEAILAKHDRLIIFYNYNYELELLKEILREDGREFAGWNGQQHDLLPEGESWAYLVQYTAGAEGWNCTSTNVIVYWSMNYSYKVMEQSAGRIDRLNTEYTDLYYYYLTSRAPIDLKVRAAVAEKKNFSEAAFARSSAGRRLTEG